MDFSTIPENQLFEMIYQQVKQTGIWNKEINDFLCLKEVNELILFWSRYGKFERQKKAERMKG